MNGLEPLRLAACEFESHVSTNSTTSPIVDIIHRMNKGIYKKDYDFKLPDDLIAKYPSKKRGQSRLLRIHHEQKHDENISDLLSFFKPNDLLVFNETKVFKARLSLIKSSGGKAEILIIKKLSKYEALCLTKGIKKNKTKQKVLTQNFPVNIEILKNEEKLLKIKFDQDIDKLCTAQGSMPIPPYLNRQSTALDDERYQSIFANDAYNNSVAAPTASLHFDESLWQKVVKSVETANINLDIGYGTFQPLKDDPIDQTTKLHQESYHVPLETVKKIQNCKKNNGRVIALGTTTLRALESAVSEDGDIVSGSNDTDIFIFDGYTFKVVDCLITNFHLPMSSLLMLVSAFGGKANILGAYEHAVSCGYKFFSYGDAMLIEECLSK